MDVSHINERFEMAVELARRVGDRLVPLHRGTPMDKGRHDVVTKMDLENERILRREILGAFPKDAFLGEETDLAEGENGSVWCVDPIDGTNNFVHGLPFYTISIAWRLLSQTVFGVVYNPCTEEMYTAMVGEGARLNGQAIHVSNESDPNHALINFSLGLRNPEDYRRTLGAMRRLGDVADFRRLGSAAYELCLVADGRSDAFFERGLHPWDFAAGALILQEAGGRFTGWPEDAIASQLPGADSLRFPDLSGNIVGSNGRLHEYLLAALTPADA